MDLKWKGEAEVINSKLQFWYSWNLLTCQKVYLQLISVSYLRFQSSKNLEVKKLSEYHNE